MLLTFVPMTQICTLLISLSSFFKFSLSDIYMIYFNVSVFFMAVKALLLILFLCSIKSGAANESAPHGHHNTSVSDSSQDSFSTCTTWKLAGKNVIPAAASGPPASLNYVKFDESKATGAQIGFNHPNILGVPAQRVGPSGQVGRGSNGRKYRVPWCRNSLCHDTLSKFPRCLQWF